MELHSLIIDRIERLRLCMVMHIISEIHDFIIISWQCNLRFDRIQEIDSLFFIRVVHRASLVLKECIPR